MKKLLFLFMFPVFCFGQYTSIPDSIFEQKLINLGYDTIHDGQVLTANIVNIDSLHLVPPNGGWFGFPLYSGQISDLTGIEGFTSLTYLNCSRNRFSSLDLSQNTALQFLDCSGWYNSMGQFIAGNLLNLDLSQNTALTHLICQFNKLSNLDLSQNTLLYKINCSNNSLQLLDLSQNNSLNELNCSGPQILNLDLTQNTALTTLDCSSNLYENLDLTQNIALTTIICSGGQNYGNPSGRLTDLDLRNGNNINMLNFDASNNPSLYCISVDDSTWSSNNWNNIDYHTIFSNNCNSVQFAAPGYTAIPDTVFEGKLISLGYDTLIDGQVLTANISNIDSLDISSSYIFDGIYSLIGLEDFTNLTYLNCKKNPVTTIDVSQNSQLTHLIYQGQAGMGGSFSNLINLVLPQSNNLIHLECPFNILESLDISQNSSLQYLDCSFNNSMFGGLDSVNLTQNPNLEFINLMATGIDKLDVSQNNLLKKLYCHNLIGVPSSFSSSQNSIENLDLTQNSILDTLICSGNRLTNLDLTQNFNLSSLNCNSNKLTHLDLRNGNNLNFSNFNATNNDSLYCISVDDSIWSVNNWTDIDSHTSFSNNCNSLQLYTLIPDTIFEQKLIDLGYDNVHDGQVLTANISSIDSLYISGTLIEDLTGIEDFNALTYLNCSFNGLTNLDVSNNTALTYLNCSFQHLFSSNIGLTNLNFSQNNLLEKLICDGNPLTSLDLSNNTALTYLSCGENDQLTSLDVSNNTALTFLNCRGLLQINPGLIGGLTSLDLSQNNNLDTLICDLNKLTSLDLSNNNALTYLNCSRNYNQLTSLDVSQNPNLLETLICDGNPLTSLDVSQNTSLKILSCSYNNLTSLDLTQNSVLTHFLCSNNNLMSLDLRNGNNANLNNGNNTSNPAFDVVGNDSLFCISVDDSAWSSNNWTNIDSHTNFSNDCNPSSIGIIEIEKNLSVYPNPTSEEITISINNFNGNIQSEVYDLIGNRLQLTNETTISLGDYSNGIYILKVSYGNRVEEVKVIKN